MTYFLMRRRDVCDTWSRNSIKLKIFTYFVTQFRKGEGPSRDSDVQKYRPPNLHRATLGYLLFQTNPGWCSFTSTGIYFARGSKTVEKSLILEGRLMNLKSWYRKKFNVNTKILLFFISSIFLILNTFTKLNKRFSHRIMQIQFCQL